MTPRAPDPPRRTRIAARTLTVLIFLAGACADTPELRTQPTFTAVSNSQPPDFFTGGLRVTFTDDLHDSLLVVTSKGKLEAFLDDPAMLERLQTEGFGDDSPLWAVVAGPQHFSVQRRPLPAYVPVPSGSDCLAQNLIRVVQPGVIAHRVEDGICGMSTTLLAVEFTADGVNIADARFIDNPPAPSTGTTAGIDRPGLTHLDPGTAIDVSGAPVPGVDITDIGVNVCFDITIRTGTYFDGVTPVSATVEFPDFEDPTDRTIVPVVDILSGGEPIDIEPGAPLGQGENLTVTYSYGPINPDEAVPDGVRVAEGTGGEIESWDVSARHC